MMDSKKQGGRKNDRISESNTDRSRGRSQKKMSRKHIFAGTLPTRSLIHLNRYLAPSLLYQ